MSRRDRRLYYANVKRNVRENLGVDSLLAMLQSSKVKIKRQIAYFDACSNMAREPELLNADSFQSGAATADVIQSLFFASSPGQVARNSAMLGGGVFSAKLLVSRF